MSGHADVQSPLRNFRKLQDYFVGIDSDGCAFDTMEVKHKECFIPNIIKIYGLAAVSKYAREAAEFVNLYSSWRGINRFPGLVKTFDLLADRPELARRGVSLPPLNGLRRWIASESKLANATLKHAVETTGDTDLATALAWSEAVNISVGEIVHGVPPFRFMRESLQKLAGKADVMVVSATPGEALAREWEEHDLSNSVALIAGQELGSKQDQIALATTGRYERNRVLMIGDASGDLKAAEANGVLFYPINPGREDDSWQEFLEVALPRFYSNNYAGHYMEQKVDEFKALLPEIPTWKRS